MFVHHAMARRHNLDAKLAYRVFLEPRIDGAHRRLIQVTKMLETVWKPAMGGPVVLV